MGFLKARQTKAKVAPVSYVVDSSNRYYFRSECDMLLRELAATLADSGLSSTGVRGQDPFGIATFLRSSESAIWVEDESLTIGADTAGGRTADWRITIAVLAGASTGTRTVVVSTPLYLTRDDELVHEQEYMTLRSVIEHAITTGHPPFEVSRPGGEPYEESATHQGVADGPVPGQLVPHPEADLRGPVDAEVVLTSGAGVDTLLGFLDVRIPYPHATTGDGRSYELGTESRSTFTFALQPRDDRTVLRMRAELRPGVNDLDAAMAAGQAAGIVKMVRLGLKTDDTTTESAPTWMDR